MEPAFDASGTYVLLEDGGGAIPVTVTPTFWPELISGVNRSEGVRRIAEGTGWLVITSRRVADAPSWEIHPFGEELLYMLSGAVDVILKQPDGEHVIPLRRGTAFLVPRGTWHRTVTREPGDMLAMTYGKGTRHRPIESEEKRT